MDRTLASGAENRGSNPLERKKVQKRWSARAVEWGDLEHHYARNGIEGSNPSSTARYLI